MIRVSIYIPTKDREADLRRAVESVLSQSYPSIELIVVNDGSTDCTRDYLDALAATDERVRVFHNQLPAGAPAARNKAIVAAQGEFVTGLDDDDAFHPDRIIRFLDRWTELSNRGVAPSCLYSQDVVVRDNQSSVVTRKPAMVSVEQLMHRNCVGNQIFAPRKHLIDAGLFDQELPAWQDLEFFIRVIAMFGSAYLVDSPTYYFDDSQRDDRISKKSRDRIDAAFKLVAMKHAADNPRKRQALFLQIFSDFYGFRPTLRDWRHFVSEGFWLWGMLRMMKAIARGAKERTI